MTNDEVLKERDELRDRLAELGICVKCNQIIDHHIDEPFATCGCGTMEWSGKHTLIMEEQISKYRAGRYAGFCEVFHCVQVQPDLINKKELLKWLDDKVKK